jgi:iron complex outermembrane receptor protein
MKPITTLFLIPLTLMLFIPHHINAQQVVGVVKDAETNEPVPFVYVHLEEIERITNGDREGEFRFQNIPAGRYTLAIHRIGYKDYHREVEISSGEEFFIEIILEPVSFTSDEITVVSERERGIGAHLEHASIKISGEALRRNLGTTLSETLINEPGFSERSLGSASGRPVIRGLGGERVLILQDGNRSGDVSSQSADHAVSIDPGGAEEIEIARGPAALAYGANAIGGVVNVVSNQIPNSLPGSVFGEVSLQGQSVNSEGSATIDLTIPADQFAIHADFNGRTGGDFSSPSGDIINSNLQNTHSTVGASYINDRGFVGASASMYLSDYGIPPDPFGGHPNGVDIEMRKYQYDVRAQRTLNSNVFRLAEARYSFVNYNHKEIESSGVLGTEFGKLTGTLSLKLQNRNWFIFSEGSVGIWAEYQDYAVRGARTPDSNQYNGAAYFIQEGDAGRLHFEIGSRFEYVVSSPKEERTSPRIGEIRQREFSGLANSASFSFNAAQNLYIGTTAMHSFRAPSLEELFSEGPHLAAYSFEIGSPDLDPERGFGLELFLRYDSDRFSAEIAGYQNRFSNYLYARDTGQQSISDPSLNNYQFVGENALFTGIELSSQFQMTRLLRVGGTFSYTIAERDLSPLEQELRQTESETVPLPMIPPLNGSLFVEYSNRAFTANTRFVLSDKQTRLGEFETRTDAYELWNASVQYRFSTERLLHTITLNGKNLLNTTYRNHLSRIKEVFPAPGRNISLLYKVYF